MIEDRSWPNCELNTLESKQQIGSAFRSSTEQGESRVIYSEIDPLQPLVLPQCEQL